MEAPRTFNKKNRFDRIATSPSLNSTVEEKNSPITEKLVPKRSLNTRKRKKRYPPALYRTYKTKAVRKYKRQNHRVQGTSVRYIFEDMKVSREFKITRDRCKGDKKSKKKSRNYGKTNYRKCGHQESRKPIKALNIKGTSIHEMNKWIPKQISMGC